SARSLWGLTPLASSERASSRSARGVLQGKRRIVAEGDALTLVKPRIAEEPSLGADGGNAEIEAVGVGQCVWLAGGIGLPSHGLLYTMDFLGRARIVVVVRVKGTPLGR